MTEIRPGFDDEIDLFELVETLWSEKWLISAFIAMSVFFSGGYLLVKEVVYESRLVYSVDTVPPFYGAGKASSDFHKMFYSANVFDDWKRANTSSTLTSDDLSDTEIVDGFVLAKDEDDRLATFASEKKVGAFVRVKSNQLSSLNDFFLYARHINTLLKTEYVLRAKEELIMIETRFRDLGASNETVIRYALDIDRYINAADKGADVLRLQRPSKPEKVSPKTYLILALSVLLGGMAGVVFVLSRNAFSKRKEALAEK